MHESSGQPPPSPDRLEAQFLAELITVRAGELAEHATRALAARLGGSPHPASKQRWRESFTGRLHELASAISSNEPDVLATQVAWAKIAYHTRGAPVADIDLSLVVLAEVLKRELPPEDHALVESHLAHARRVLAIAPVDAPPLLSTGSPHGVLASRYLLAVLEGDRRRAVDLVINAVVAGLDVRDAYLAVLIPVQQEIGRMWHTGELTIAEEHFATSTAVGLAAQLLALAPTRIRDGRVVLAASVEGNTHDLGVRVLADFFEMEGWRCVHLGANVPAEDLAQACRDFRPHLVALSAALPEHLRRVEDAIRLIRDTDHRRPLPVLVGGHAFRLGSELWRTVGADAYAKDIPQALQEADRLVPPKPLPVKPSH